MARYKVAEGTQVNVDGKIYGSGETFESDGSDELRLWLRAGYIEENTTKKSTTKSSSGRKTR